jgi:hypothetical protein
MASKSAGAQAVADELNRLAHKPMKIGAAAKKKVSELSQEYLTQLSIRSIQVARNADVELVSVPHVEIARQQLELPRLRVGWWSRLFFAGAGGSASICVSTIIGSALAEHPAGEAAADVLPTVLVIVTTGLLALALAVLAFFSEGWRRHP